LVYTQPVEGAQQRERKMAHVTLSEQDWLIRLHVYQYFVAHGRPPSFIESAAALGIPADETRAAYRRLHDGHALFLEPGTDDVRMANPLSAVPTPYRVTVAGRPLWANCAWDSLGIPAMLHAEARIDAVLALAGAPTSYRVEAGTLRVGEAGVVHFPLPFHRWYDDLIHT
jgi:hypothetical protein